MWLVLGHNVVVKRRERRSAEHGGTVRTWGKCRTTRKMQNSGNELKKYFKTKDIAIFSAAFFARFSRNLAQSGAKRGKNSATCARRTEISFGKVKPENDRLSASMGTRETPFAHCTDNWPTARTPSPGPPRLKRAPAAAHPLPQGGEGLGQVAARRSPLPPQGAEGPRRVAERRSRQDGHRLIFCRSSVILGVRNA